MPRDLYQNLMRQAIVIVMAFAHAAIGQEPDTVDPLADLKTTYKHLVDRTGDVVVGRALVPSKKKPQGEVSLIKRGRAWVVRSLIYTKYPTRMLKEVHKKENKAWPKKDMPGKKDSEAYLENLDKAMAVVNEAYKKDKPEDTRRKLLIELIFSPKHALVVFSSVTLKQVDGREIIVSATPLRFTTLGRAYTRRELELIIEDSLKYSADTCKEIFQVFPEPVEARP